MSSENITREGLPDIKRHITTHNDEGIAVYLKNVDESLDFYTITTDDKKSAGFGLGYVTDAFPVPLNNDQDLSTFKEVYANRKKIGLVKHGGTILRYVDIPPNANSPMHRTESLDYGIVIAGEVECELDSGESRTVRPGDVVVQRGTMHKWVNHHPDQWARIVFVLLHATPVEIGGKRLGEDQNGMGVPDSH